MKLSSIIIVVVSVLIVFAAGPPGAAAEKELDIASQVTGIELAEKRSLNADEEITKTDGATNDFLAAAKRHQLEFAELLGLAQALKEQLSDTDSYYTSDEEVEALLQQNAALQIQALRYVQALEMSQSYLRSGYRPASDNPRNWDGRMCNDQNECVNLDPITALFTIATAQIRP